MKISDLDSFKEYKVKNKIMIIGGTGEESGSNEIEDEERPKDKPWWHIW